MGIARRRRAATGLTILGAVTAGLSLAGCGGGGTLSAGEAVPGPTTPVKGIPRSTASSVGPATHLAFLQQPTGALLGSPMVPGVQVAVEDANGNIVTTATRKIGIALASGPAGSISGTFSVTPVNGVATFSNLVFSTAGSYSLQAASAALGSGPSQSFQIGSIPASWTLENSGGFGSAAFDVAVGTVNGQQVLVATDGGGVLARSVDGGTTWQQTLSFSLASGGVNAGLATVAFGNGIFVCASQMSIYTSRDGANWKLSVANLDPPGHQRGAYIVRFCGDRFLVGQGSGIDQGDGAAISTSTDGTDWTEQTQYYSHFFTSGRPLGGITAVSGTPGNYYAVSSVDGGIVTSSDGISWEAPPNAHWQGPTLEGVEEEQSYSQAPRATLQPLAVSANGTLVTAFQNSTHGTGGSWNLVRGATGDVFTSTDGGNNFSLVASLPEPVMDMCFANGEFVAVTEHFAAFSPDGFQWTVSSQLSSATNPGLYMVGLASNGTTFFAAGRTSSLNDGDLHQNISRATVTTMLASSDGNHWSQNLTWPEADLTCVTSGTVSSRSLYVAGGLTGVLVTSPDGIHWSPENVPTYLDISTMAYGNGTFVAMASDTTNPTLPQQTVLRSIDGVNWTATPFAPPLVNADEGVNKITFGNGVFVAVGGGINTMTSPSSLIMTSPDGVTWTRQTAVSTNPIVGVGYVNGTFMTIDVNQLGARNDSEVSPDGVHWALGNLFSTNVTGDQGYILPPSFDFFNGGTVVFGDGSFFAAARSENNSSIGNTANLSSFPPVWTGGPMVNDVFDAAFSGGAFVQVGDAGAPPSVIQTSSGTLTGFGGSISPGLLFSTQASDTVNLFSVSPGVADSFAVVGDNGHIWLGIP